LYIDLSLRKGLFENINIISFPAGVHNYILDYNTLHLQQAKWNFIAINKN